MDFSLNPLNSLNYFPAFPKIMVAATWVALISYSAQSQGVTIQTEPAPVEYYRMPDQPLPATYTTYNAEVSVNFSDLAKSGFTENELVETYLHLEGYRRMTKNGDVEITANIGEFIVWSEIRNTTRTKSKDKEGNSITKYKYNIEVKYSQPMSVEVFNKEGKALLDDYVFTMSDTRTWFSPSYDDLSDLESYWRIQRTTRLNDLQKDLTKEGMNKMKDMINSSFGYRLIRDNARFETIGKKKHPDYEKFQANVELLQDAFKLMSADKGLEEVKAKSAPALLFYNESTARYRTGDKDQEKLKHICLYNQALAYFWLEDFEQAEMFAEAIQKFDRKDKDAKRLLQDIEYTKASLTTADRPSRHQVVVGSRT